ncbi:MAG: hypothetical protein H0U75_10150 [Legionella sp.]|nr:hypothetical protein [Legionella sp.]
MPKDIIKTFDVIESLTLRMFSLLTTHNDDEVHVFFNTFPFNKLEDAIKNESHQFYKTMFMFYKTIVESFYELWMMYRLTKQIGIDPELFNLLTIGKKLKEPLGMVLLIPSHSPVEWDKLKYSQAFRTSLYTLFHQNTLYEDGWKMIEGPLVPLLQFIIDSMPSVQANKEVIYLPINGIINFMATLATTSNIHSTKENNTDTKKEKEIKTNDIVFLQNTIGNQTNHLGKLWSIFSLIYVCSDAHVAVDYLSEYDLPVVFPSEFPAISVQLIQSFLAFRFLESLIEKKHDAEFLLFHIDNFAKLGYFPESMRVDETIGIELSIVNAILCLENHISGLKPSLPNLPEKVWAIEQMIYQLCIAILPYTRSIEGHLPLEKLAIFARDALMIPRSFEAYFEDGPERCLFYIRPLQIIIEHCDKTNITIKSFLDNQTLAYLVQQAIKLSSTQAWDLLEPSDVIHFLHCTTTVLKTLPPIVMDAQYYKAINGLIVRLCQESMLGEAYLILAMRFSSTKSAKKTAEPAGQFDTQLLYLLRFIYFLPKVDILETTLPTELEKAAHTFNDALKHRIEQLSIRKLALQEYSKKIAEINPIFLKEQFPGLIENIKLHFFSKKQFFLFQMHYYCFLDQYDNDGQQSSEHLNFKDILLKIAHLLDESEIPVLHELLHPPVQQPDIIAFTPEEDKPIKPNLGLKVAESRAARLFKKFNEKEKTMSVVAATAVDANPLSLLACLRYYHVTKKSYPLGELKQNEFLTILIKLIGDLLHLPLNRVTTTIDEQIEKILYLEVKRNKPSTPFESKSEDGGQELSKQLKNIPVPVLNALEFKRRDTSNTQDIQLPCNSALSALVIPERHRLATSVTIKKISAMLMQCKDQTHLTQYFLDKGYGLQSLQRFLFFRLIHEYHWPMDEHSKDLVTFLLKAKNSKAETLFLQYLDCLQKSPFSQKGTLEIPNSDNPFLQAYQKVLCDPLVGLEPLEPINYTGISPEQSYFVGWNKVFLTILFLKTQIISHSFKKEQWTTQIKNLAKSGYFLDVPKDQESFHTLLSYLMVLKRCLLMLKVNYDYLQINQEIAQTRFLNLAEATSLVNHVSIDWFENLKKGTIPSNERLFVFSNASEYITGMLSAPISDKKKFLRLLLIVCLEAKKDNEVLKLFTLDRFTAFLDLLVKEDMLHESIVLLRSYSALGDNYPIPEEDIKSFMHLTTVLEYANWLINGGAHKSKQEYLHSFKALTEHFLNKHFVNITHDRLIALTKDTVASTTLSQPSPVNLPKKKKRKHKKSSTEANLSDLTATQTQTQPSCEVKLERVTDILQTALPTALVVPEGEASTLPPLTSVISEQTVLKDGPLPAVPSIPPILNCSQQTDFPLAESWDLVTPTTSFFTSTKNPSFFQEEHKEMNTTPSPYVNYLLSHPAYSASSLSTESTNDLKVTKYLSAKVVPQPLLDLVNTINKMHAGSRVALVGPSLVAMALNMVQSNHFAKSQMVIIVPDTKTINKDSLVQSFYTALNHSPNVFKCEIKAQKISVRLSDKEHKFYLVVEVLTALAEDDPILTLNKYLQSRSFNLERLCLLFPTHFSGAFRLQGSQETITSLNAKQIKLHNIEELTPEDKLIALFELAHHELYFPTFERDQDLSTLCIEDLEVGFASLMANPESPLYAKFLQVFRSLFSLKDIRQVIQKLNSMWLIHAMTSILPHQIQERLSAMDSETTTFDDNIKINRFSFFVYFNFSFLFKQTFEHAPWLLQQSAFRKFIFDNLTQDARVQLTWIDDWTMHKKILPADHESNDLFKLIYKLHACHNRQNQNTSLPLNRYVLWQQFPPQVYNQWQNLPTARVNPSNY